MQALAVVLEKPGALTLRPLELSSPGAEDVVVAVDWTGISTGTERLLWSGRMPPFPGMGYPLVPGYETVGRVIAAGDRSGRSEGDAVFVPGARCFGDVRGLFGGAASRLVTAGARTTLAPTGLGEQAVLLALAATAQHARAASKPGRELIVGHGVLGRLLARLSVAAGGEPVVWETNSSRRDGALGYAAVDPADDARCDYEVVYDVSGDSTILDRLIPRLAPGGEIVLAGFYDQSLAFAFPAAFMREARIRVAAEWRPADLDAVTALLAAGALSLDGLITHRRGALDAGSAYRTAFEDPSCIKMVLDWRDCA
ncbi:chlorophyll synthesis pathway protein BchC [Alsobacter sp. KACC 23698]|uniref:Chlorophyll synthesis pathway protein BchC n=1 Tax=Alsobacter sp. KACC 23698 TaxID=3149229 RepID=A0AAU7JER1_9HYPH